MKRTAPPALIASRAAAIGKDRSFPLEPIRRRRSRDETFRYDDYVNAAAPDHDNDDNADTARTLYNTSIFGKLPNLGGKLLSETTKHSQDTDRAYIHFSRGADMSSSSGNQVRGTSSSSMSKLTNGVARLTVTKPTNGVAAAGGKPKAQMPRTPSSSSSQPVAPSRVRNAPPPPATVRDAVAAKKITTTTAKPVASNVRTAVTNSAAAPLKKPASLAPPKTRPKPAPAIQTKKKPVRTATPPGMSTCKICGRHFAPERIKLHESICEKSTKKKRKTFDPLKQRLKGTEAEGMINQIKSSAKVAQVGSFIFSKMYFFFFFFVNVIFSGIKVRCYI